MNDEKQFCEQHGVMCNNMKNLKEEIDDVRDSLDKFKQYTYGKFDEIRSTYDDLKERFIKFETKVEIKLDTIEKLLENRKTNWGLFIGQFLYPILVAIVLYLVLKK